MPNTKSRSATKPTNVAGTKGDTPSDGEVDDGAYIDAEYDEK